MIIGIGCDIIEINRVEKAVKSESFKQRVFTEAEIACTKFITRSLATASAILRRSFFLASASLAMALPFTLLARYW